MKLIGIKTNDGYYVTDDLENKSYNRSSIASYLINGETPQKTFNEKWFKVSSEPVLIQHYKSQPPINKRFELIDKTLSDRFSDMFLYEAVCTGRDDEYCEIFIDEFKNIRPLYEFKQDSQPDVLEDVVFQYETIQHIQEIPTKNGFSYKVLGDWNKPYFLGDSSVKYDMISQIVTPSVLLHMRACSLTSKESFDIVRNYIVENINHAYAEITSNYDFCFTVEKRIKLAQPFKTRVKISKRGREPRYNNIMQEVRKVKIFEMTYSPKNYERYTPIAGFTGNSLEDLKNNIDNYLRDLILIINEPMQDCPYCNGSGVKVSAK